MKKSVCFIIIVGIFLVFIQCSSSDNKKSEDVYPKVEKKGPQKVEPATAPEK